MLFPKTIWPRQAPDDATAILQAAFALVADKGDPWSAFVEFGALRRMTELPRERFDAVVAGLYRTDRIFMRTAGIDHGPINPNWLAGGGSTYFTGFHISNDAFNAATWDDDGKINLNVNAYDRFREVESLLFELHCELLNCKGEPPAVLVEAKRMAEELADLRRLEVRQEREALGDFKEYDLYRTCDQQAEDDQESNLKAIEFQERLDALFAEREAAGLPPPTLKEINQELGIGLGMFDDDDGESWKRA